MALTAGALGANQTTAAAAEELAYDGSIAGTTEGVRRAAQICRSVRTLGAISPESRAVKDSNSAAGAISLRKP